MNQFNLQLNDSILVKRPFVMNNFFNQPNSHHNEHELIKELLEFLIK